MYDESISFRPQKFQLYMAKKAELQQHLTGSITKLQNFHRFVFLGETQFKF